MKLGTLVTWTGIAFILTVSSVAQAPVQERAADQSKTSGYRVDGDTIRRFSPRADPKVVAVMLQQWKMAEDAGINSPDRVNHFMAQMATETTGFKDIAEHMHYSAQRLLEVFPSRVTPQDAQRLTGNPVLIANHVYGGRLGNHLPNDGWNYRGSGLIQLTGRGNFSSRGKELHLPFEENPEMVRTPEAAFQAAVAYWTARAVNTIADTGDLRKVRIAVNGGTNGLTEAGVWFGRARKSFVPGLGAREMGDDEELLAIEQMLRARGVLGSPTSGDRSAPVDLEAGLKQFQRGRGLPETGQVDEDTFYQLLDRDNFRKDEH